MVGSSAEVKKRAATTVRVVDAAGRVLASPGGAIVRGTPATLVLLDGPLAVCTPAAIAEAPVALRLEHGHVIVDIHGLTH